MKFCSKCGNELHDEAVICPKCGCAVDEIQTRNTSGSNNAITVAKVFIIIGCVFSGLFFLISLSWTIPMTVIFFKKIKNGERIGTGFKVCILLFVSLISGIILLTLDD